MHNNKAPGEKHQNTSRFWILGAGRFGRIAVSRITRRFPKATLTVVDKRKIVIEAERVATVCANAIDWLVQHLDEDASVDMLVPAVPEHVAAGWLTTHLKREFKIQNVPIPDDWVTRLPHAMRGDIGQVFVSHADFLCPDNCPEPKDRCTHTGKSRPVDMFRLLADITIDDYLPIVLHSHQLLPGVGGVYPADLFQALKTARNNSHRPLMIATACRCHGVVDFIRFS